MVKVGDMKELKFGGASSCIFWKRCRGELILIGKLVEPMDFLS